MGKTLIITTSADMMGDHPTGAWLEEIAAPYNVFTAAGCTTDIASVKGGVCQSFNAAGWLALKHIINFLNYVLIWVYRWNIALLLHPEVHGTLLSLAGVIPIDAGSRGEGFYTEDCKTFEANEEAMKKFNESIPLDTVDVCAYDIIFLSGGHGCCVDFESTPSVLAAVDKMVSCSGPSLQIRNNLRAPLLIIHAPIVYASRTSTENECLRTFCLVKTDITARA
eukprot:6350744-Pyramimonas_sp.AAC.1